MLYSAPSVGASSPSVASAMPICALHSTRPPKSKQPRQRSAAAVPRSLANLLCCELKVLNGGSQRGMPRPQKGIESARREVRVAAKPAREGLGHRRRILAKKQEVEPQ